MTTAILTDYESARLVQDVRRIKHEILFHHEHKIPLEGSFIVFAERLQNEIFALSHKGYPGLTRTTRLLREHAWFTKMDKLVDNAIQHFSPCQASSF